MGSRKDKKHSKKKRRSSDEAASSRSTSSSPIANTLVANGWRLYQWRGFRERWETLRVRAGQLRANDPENYRSHRDVVLFAAVYKLVTEVIPRDPGGPQFRQGHTLGSEYTHWRRAKFLQRFRLFFRYHTPSQSIVYVWLNDENTLRKANSRTDVYSTFKRMLESEDPPTDWDALITESMSWE